MSDSPLFFDMDRKILVNSRDVNSPLPDEEVPWFSTRYPVKVTLQAISKGYPAIVGQQPIKVSLTRGTTKYCDLWAISGQNPWFVVPSLAVTPGPLRVELRDGLDNVILQFDTMCIDSIPENPAEIPTIFSNPTSVRIKDEGERIIRAFLLEDHYSSDKASGLKKYLNPFKSNGAWTWENPDPAVNLLRTLRLGTVSLPRPVRDSRKVPSGEDPDETDKNLDDWLEEYVEGIEE